MSRPELAHPPVHPEAARRMSIFQADVVESVRSAVVEHAVVVVGMAGNPHVRRARRTLDEAGVPYHYIGLGSYVSMWKQRLAVKLWSGWPTFPQVYANGALLGGADQVKPALADGTISQAPGASTPAGV